MNGFTNKENIILKQCHEGPYHTIVTDLTNIEFNNLVKKLINNDDANTLITLTSIYWDYNRDTIIDYFIKKRNVELLLNFLDYCNDFQTPENELNQTYIINKLIETNDIEFIKEILKTDKLYFLTDKKEKERLIQLINKN